MIDTVKVIRRLAETAARRRREYSYAGHWFWDPGCGWVQRVRTELQTAVPVYKPPPVA